MRNAWYIVASSAEITKQPIAKTIHGVDLVLYRHKSGAISAFLNQCPHRGARLSDGTIVNGHLCCPFHGWQFDSTGTCKYIPANGRESKIPNGCELTAFAAQEKAGYVWVNSGNLIDSYDMPKYLELEDPLWHGVPFQVTWNAHYSRIIESILDVSHLPFVHKQTTGENVDPMVDGPIFEVQDQEIVIRAASYQRDLQSDNNVSTITFNFPNSIILRTNMHEDQSMATFLSFTPIDEEHTTIYGIALRNFLHDMDFIDDFHYEHNLRVLEEDRPVVEGLRPNVSPLDLQQEIHVRSDGPQVRYRILLRKALEMESIKKESKGESK